LSDVNQPLHQSFEDKEPIPPKPISTDEVFDAVDDTSNQTPDNTITNVSAVPETASADLFKILDQIPNSVEAYRPILPTRPTNLPEPIDETLSTPLQTEDDTLAYLPPLPHPHADSLWPFERDTLFRPDDTALIDLLASQKSELCERQSLEIIYKNKKAEPNTWKIVAREIAETLLLTALIFFTIQLFIKNFRVVGTSMVNNLKDGQYLIIDKVSYYPIITNFGFGGIERGDVVVFEPPNRPEDDYVKRVIGLPGETVEVIKGQIYINGDLLPEPFQPRTGTYSMPPMEVGEGEIFVLGDNRNNSNDSHNWGPLPMENIVGRAWISYWPPSLWGTIPNDRPSDEATLKYIIETIVPSANAEENSTE